MHDALQARTIQYRKTLDHFFDEFVPSTTPYVSRDDTTEPSTKDLKGSEQVVNESDHRDLVSIHAVTCVYDHSTVCSALRTKQRRKRSPTNEEHFFRELTRHGDSLPLRCLRR